MQAPAYALHGRASSGFEETLGRVREALAQQGFGVLTEIDVQETLRKKLGVDVPRETILGACAPQTAHQALQIEADVALLLPCNVVVRDAGDGSTDVSAIRPTVLFERLVEAQGIEELAEDIEAKLERAVHASTQG